LTGGVDTLLFLDHKRGEPEALLRVTGRDVEGDDLPLVRPRGLPFWIVAPTPKSPEGIELDEHPALVVNIIRSKTPSVMPYRDLRAAFAHMDPNVLDSTLSFLVSKKYLNLAGRDAYSLPYP